MFTLVAFISFFARKCYGQWDCADNLSKKRCFELYQSFNSDNERFCAAVK